MRWEVGGGRWGSNRGCVTSEPPLYTRKLCLSQWVQSGRFASGGAGSANGTGTSVSHRSVLKDTRCHHNEDERVMFYEKGVYVYRHCCRIYHYDRVKDKSDSCILRSPPIALDTSGALMGRLEAEGAREALRKQT